MPLIYSLAQKAAMNFFSLAFIDKLYASVYMGVINSKTEPSAMTSGTNIEAIERGFTRHVLIESTDGMTSFAALIHPDAELDDRFRAFDTDNQEWLIIKGWNCLIEPLGEEA